MVVVAVVVVVVVVGDGDDVVTVAVGKMGLLRCGSAPTSPRPRLAKSSRVISPLMSARSPQCLNSPILER